MLKNAFLSFLAVIDFPFEFRCRMWGKYPQIVTFDACMKLVSNYVTKDQLTASRPEQTIDNDLMMLLLKLSLVSPIFFGGTRVKFVVGAGEATGSSPVWVRPGNRLSEKFKKSQRGVVRDGQEKFKDGEGAALIEALDAKGGEIGLVDNMPKDELKALYRKVFEKGINKVINELQNESYNMRILERLLESVSDHPEGNVSVCLETLWACGRCFCTHPVMRVFDCFGRVDVVFLKEVLSLDTGS